MGLGTITGKEQTGTHQKWRIKVQTCHLFMYPGWYRDQPAYDGNSVSIKQKHHVLSILLNSLNTPTNGGGIEQWVKKVKDWPF